MYDYDEFPTTPTQLESSICLTPPTPVKKKEKIEQHTEEPETFEKIENLFPNYSMNKFAAAVINGDFNTRSCNAILNLKKDPNFKFEDVTFTSFSQITKSVEKKVNDEVLFVFTIIFIFIFTYQTN